VYCVTDVGRKELPKPLEQIYQDFKE